MEGKVDTYPTSEAELVTEYMDRLIPGMDKDLSKELLRSLKKLGIEFYLNHAVKDVKSTTKMTTLTADTALLGAPEPKHLPRRVR